LSTLVYDVVFPDGTIKKYDAVNVITENLITNCGLDGYSTTTMESILNHKRDGSAVPMYNKYIDTKKGQRKLRQMTVGWHFQVKWRDGQETWVPLSDLKESNPVDIAEYATARGISEVPAFAWWVPYTLSKRDVIISAVNSRVRKKSHKYRLEISTSIEDAKRINA